MISPPRMTIAIGCSISWPGTCPATTSGTRARPVASGRHQDRREPLPRPAQHQLRPERLALDALEVLEVADHHDAVACRDAEDREEADQRAERQIPPVASAARTPPTRAIGSVGRTAGPAARLPKATLQQQEDRRRARPSAERARSVCWAACALGVLAEHLGVVARAGSSTSAIRLSSSRRPRRRRGRSRLR